MTDSLPIPGRGLETVCSLWTGRGQLWDAVSAASDSLERRWSAGQVELRALRVLCSQTVREQASLPSKRRDWENALPSESLRRERISTSPTSRVNWAKTAKNGWPPSVFAMRRRDRRADALLLTSLRWASDLALRLSTAAPMPSNRDEALAFERLQILAGLRDSSSLVANAAPQRPSGSDRRMLHVSGTPWRQLGELIDKLAVIESSDLSQLALVLLAPDEKMRGSLFHLAILGEVIAALKDAGATVISNGPIASGVANTGPAFDIQWDGQRWHLWFEGAAIWRARGLTQPYMAASTNVVGRGRPLGPDLLLVDAARRSALMIECKYSADPSVVARDGYHQATTYLGEAMAHLCHRGLSLVVGPEGVIDGDHITEGFGGAIGFTCPSRLGALTQHFMQDLT